jgi:phosphoglucomutase
VPRLITAYYSEVPDPAVPAQRVAFGTSGHRGSSFNRSFNEAHVLAITQAICLYRTRRKIAGPLFLGIDTHALSVPACATALEVLAANGVEVMIAAGDEYTPTPVISHAILTYNRGANRDWPTGLSSLPRTIRRRMAASNTTRRTGGRPTTSSPTGSRPRRMRCSKPASNG